MAVYDENWRLPSEQGFLRLDLMAFTVLLSGPVFEMAS